MQCRSLQCDELDPLAPRSGIDECQQVRDAGVAACYMSPLLVKECRPAFRSAPPQTPIHDSGDAVYGRGGLRNTPFKIAPCRRTVRGVGKLTGKSLRGPEERRPQDVQPRHGWGGATHAISAE